MKVLQRDRPPGHELQPLLHRMFRSLMVSAMMIAKIRYARLEHRRLKFSKPHVTKPFKSFSTKTALDASTNNK